MSMKLMSAVLMSVGIGFAGAAWAASGTAEVPGSVAKGKNFGCGAKGQKACPMQGWMKAVMQSATTRGDGAKIASALEYVAPKPSPGMRKWVAISKDGAEKAKKGDIDGSSVRAGPPNGVVIVSSCAVVHRFLFMVRPMTMAAFVGNRRDAVRFLEP
ncbi:hypothetical protein [Sorangium sp. So ce128]|uniref:hypothetical protein n=1 Tax=Sorangium sp. So ce128 TaxID=3133281 RepID=UPI003F5E6A59